MAEATVANAVAVLRRGGLIALPTETVYGLGADAKNPDAVAKIFALKGRPANHPLIVHLADIAQLPQWAIDIPEGAKKLAAAFWPGPLTIILKRAADVPDAVTGGQDTVGIRIPAHPLALEILRAFGGGIAAPSANRFGHVSPTTAQHVRNEFGDAVEIVLDGGACGIGIESTIIDFSRGYPVLLRPGRITAAGIKALLHESVMPADITAPRASGTLEAHYAPGTPLRIVPASNIPALIKEQNDKRVAILSRSTQTAASASRWLMAPFDATGYAHDLYANLRLLDATGCDLIVVEALPEGEEWLGVTDRLSRAQAGSVN